MTSVRDNVVNRMNRHLLYNLKNLGLWLWNASLEERHSLCQRELHHTLAIDEQEIEDNVAELLAEVGSRVSFGRIVVLVMQRWNGQGNDHTMMMNATLARVQ